MEKMRVETEKKKVTLLHDQVREKVKLIWYLFLNALYYELICFNFSIEQYNPLLNDLHNLT